MRQYSQFVISGGGELLRSLASYILGSSIPLVLRRSSPVNSITLETTKLGRSWVHICMLPGGAELGRSAANRPCWLPKLPRQGDRLSCPSNRVGGPSDGP